MTDSDRYFVGIPDMYAERDEFFKHASFMREAAEEKLHVAARLASGDPISEAQLVVAQQELKAFDEHSNGLQERGSVRGYFGEHAQHALSSAQRTILGA